MAWVFKHQTTGQGYVTSTFTYSITTPTTGNLLLVSVTNYGASALATSVKDFAAGNSLTLLNSETNGSACSVGLYGYNVPATPQANIRVTVPAGGSWESSCYEITGAQASFTGIVDATAVTNGTGTTTGTSWGGITTTVANDLVMGNLVTSNGSATTGVSGFTSLFDGFGTAGADGYVVEAAAGNYTPAFTLSPSSVYAMTLTAIKPLPSAVQSGILGTFMCKRLGGARFRNVLLPERRIWVPNRRILCPA